MKLHVKQLQSISNFLHIIRPPSILAPHRVVDELQQLLIGDTRNVDDYNPQVCFPKKPATFVKEITRIL